MILMMNNLVDILKKLFDFQWQQIVCFVFWISMILRLSAEVWIIILIELKWSYLSIIPPHSGMRLEVRCCFATWKNAWGYLDFIWIYIIWMLYLVHKALPTDFSHLSLYWYILVYIMIFLLHHHIVLARIMEESINYPWQFCC